MTFEIKGIPRDTCYYKPDKIHPGILQAGCSSQWIVLQEEHHFCTFCGKPIEKNPPMKPRTVA